MCYLKGSLSNGFFLKRPCDLSLVGFVDADWTSDPDDRKSITGFCVFFSENLITLRSKKQSIISRSSTDVEYRSLATIAAKLVWLSLFSLTYVLIYVNLLSFGVTI